MRIALAGLAAGIALLAPVAPASAYCEPDPTTVSRGGCSNSCVETGNRYESAREKLKLSALPSYWDLFACPMS